MIGLARTTALSILGLAHQKTSQLIRLENAATIGGREFFSKSFDLEILEVDMLIFRNDFLMGVDKNFRIGVETSDDDKSSRRTIKYGNSKIRPKIA